MNAFTLVIFDYSGTLSLGGGTFGRPDNLERHLAKSGLARIGIDTSDRYWHAVSNPTWSSASTSSAGYHPCAADCIRNLAPPGTSPEFIEKAVSSFIAAYMRHSHIDARWRPLLADIENRPDTVCLIATDHYAEATDAIIAHLSGLGIQSVPIGQKSIPAGKAGFVVANSADIGYLKANRKFWLAVGNACPEGPLKQLLCIDDFGVNEPSRSDYAATGRITDRIQMTRQALRDVFGLDPQIIHFVTEKNPTAAIGEIGLAVRKALQI